MKVHYTCTAEVPCLFICLFTVYFTHNLVSVPFHLYKITSFSSVEGDDWIEPNKSDVVPSAIYC